MSAPIRNRIEPGIFERVDAEGNRLGLEIAFKDATGAKRRRSVEGGIRAARDELAKARTKRAKREAEPADPRVTISTVIERFEEAHAGQRENTRSAYRSAFARIEPIMGDRRITAIGRVDVKAFVAAEVAAGLKANTIRGHYSALRALFSFAREDLEIPVVFPKLRPAELPDPAEDAREHRVLDDDELAAVLAACGEKSRLFFRTVAETGCRASEALGLTPQRIGDGTVTFAQQLARDHSLRPLKTRQSKRTIEITRGLAAELRLAGDDERVFPRLNHREIERLWSVALRRAALDGARPVIHDLRHTHASRLIAAGVDPVEVAKRLGDRVETVLRVYAGEWDSKRRGVARRELLEGLYGGAAIPAPEALGEVVELRR